MFINIIKKYWGDAVLIPIVLFTALLRYLKVKEYNVQNYFIALSILILILLMLFAGRLITLEKKYLRDFSYVISTVYILFFCFDSMFGDTPIPGIAHFNLEVFWYEAGKTVVRFLTNLIITARFILWIEKKYYRLKDNEFAKSTE